MAEQSYARASAYLATLDTATPQIVLLEGLSDSDGITPSNFMYPAIEKHVGRAGFEFLNWDNFALTQIGRDSYHATSPGSAPASPQSFAETMKSNLQNTNQLHLVIVLRSYFMAKKIIEVSAAHPDANITVLCGAVHAFDEIALPELRQKSIGYRVLSTPDQVALAKAFLAVVSTSLKDETSYAKVAAAIKDPGFTRDASVEAALKEIRARSQAYANAEASGGESYHQQRLR